MQARRKRRKRRKELDTSSTENSEESEFSDPDWGAKLPIRKGPVKKRKVIVVQTPGTGPGTESRGPHTNQSTSPRAGPSISRNSSAPVPATKGKVYPNNRDKPSPPLNPHGFNFVDKNGNNLDSRSREYLEQFAMVGKINLETKKKYECEFNKFIEFIGRTETNGDTLVENLEAE